MAWVKRTKAGRCWFVYRADHLPGVCVILPMIYFNVLPKTQLTSFLVAPPPPPPPPPPPAAAVRGKGEGYPPPVRRRTLMALRASRNRSRRSEKKSFRLLPRCGRRGRRHRRRRGRWHNGGVLGGIIGSVQTAVLPPPPPKKEATPQASESAATCNRPSWFASRARCIRRSPKRAIQASSSSARLSRRTAPFSILSHQRPPLLIRRFGSGETVGVPTDPP